MKQVRTEVRKTTPGPGVARVKRGSVKKKDFVTRRLEGYRTEE